MKLAVSGKGGVGKTTISAALARIFAAQGRRVLAVDSDPSMNLHTSLGLENPTPISELKDLINDRAVIAEGIFNLNPKVDDIPERFSSPEGDLRLLVMGSVKGGGQGCICPESTFLKALLRHLVLDTGDILVLDTEAGMEHLARGVAQGFDLMIIVTEPTKNSIETANQVYGLSREIGIKKALGVGNKVLSQDQEEFIKENLDFECTTFVPFDQVVAKADMEGVPLVGFEDSKALKAIQSLGESLLREYG
jgi:CO dehydrogenase maturation factor